MPRNFSTAAEGDQDYFAIHMTGFLETFETIDGTGLFQEGFVILDKEINSGNFNLYENSFYSYFRQLKGSLINFFLSKCLIL